MNRAATFLTGVGLGTGLMYFFDPQTGRRRRALVRDKGIRLAHEAQEAADVIGRDLSNRAQGLAAGDLSVLVGGKRALQNPLRGGWSPTGRAFMGLLGAGLFFYGLSRRAPTGCFLGTAGLGLIAEGLTNAGPRDLARIPRMVADNLGLGAQTSRTARQERARQPAGASA